MLASIKNLSVKAQSLMFVAVMSQAGLAFGGFTPLQHNISTPTQLNVVGSEQKSEAAAGAAAVLEQLNSGETTIPILDFAPVSDQAVAPTSVPLPPALETGLSGSAALMLGAGLRKLRRFLRRGF